MSASLETCRSLSARFYRLLDAGDYDAVAALFAPEGCWLRQGTRLVGADSIRAALERRSTEILIRHLLMNVDVEPVDENIIDVFGAVLVFRAQGKAADAPLRMPGTPSTLMNIHDRYVLTAGDWKLANKSGQRILASDSPPH